MTSFGERDNLLKNQINGENDKFSFIVAPESAPNVNVSGHLDSAKSLEAKFGTDLKNGLTRSEAQMRQTK